MARKEDPNQQPLFKPQAPWSEPDTSREAAEKMNKSERALTDRARILAFLRDHMERGATDEEMQIALQINPNTQRPRRGELVEPIGQVYDSGDKRKTRSGCRAKVWKAKAWEVE